MGKKNNAPQKGTVNVKEQKDKQQSISNIEQPEGKIYRYVFYAIAALMLILTPILSLNSGISGDEKSSYVHSSRVYDYFAKGDTAALNTQGDPLTQNLEYYGQSFDNFTYLFIKWFHIDHPYEFRHVCNALAGWCIAFIIALLLVKIAGYRTAILGFLMLLLSPRFLGHSFNNPKDIPFALGYTFAIYQMILLVKELPKTNIKRLIYIALGIGLANSIRIGGLMLVAYLMLFCGVWYFFVNKENKWTEQQFWTKGLILIAKLAVVSLCGFFVSIILWPYLQQSPFSHAKESLDLMEHYSVNLKQIFEGVNIWSTNAPWYYLPKYIFMTIPEAVILGLILFCCFIRKIVKKQRGIIAFIIVFSFAFPILYIIYKASNVYGGWRHVLFTYPFFVTAAALGWEHLYEFAKPKIRPFILALFGLLMLFPIVHIVRSHPHEYVYYNQLCGGINANYGKYETDYYQHSTRAAAKWLDNYLIDNKLKPTQGKKIIIASNDHKAIEYYFRYDTAKSYEVSYIRYYERGNSDWDYAISINTYINAYQLQQGIWPPKGTIHTIDVGGKPIAAIIKRENKSDYEGYLLKEKLSDTTLSNEERFEILQQAIAAYNDAYQYDPHNETAILNLIELYANLHRVDSMLYFTNQLVNVCPNENFLNVAINVYNSVYQNSHDQNMLNQIFALHQRMIDENPYSAQYYYNLAMMYVQMGNLNKGKELMEACMKKNKRTFEANYYDAIFLAQTGRQSEAIDLLIKAKKKFPGNADICDNLIGQIQGINHQR